MKQGTNLMLTVWFLLVGAAFWEPYFGVSLPTNVLTALYAVFLVVCIAVLALRIVKGRADTPPTP